MNNKVERAIAASLVQPSAKSTIGENTLELNIPNEKILTEPSLCAPTAVMKINSMTDDTSDSSASSDNSESSEKVDDIVIGEQIDNINKVPRNNLVLYLISGVSITVLIIVVLAVILSMFL